MKMSYLPSNYSSLLSMKCCSWGLTPPPQGMTWGDNICRNGQLSLGNWVWIQPTRFTCFKWFNFLSHKSLLCETEVVQLLPQFAGMFFSLLYYINFTFTVTTYFIFNTETNSLSNILRKHKECSQEGDFNSTPCHLLSIPLSLHQGCRTFVFFLGCCQPML